MEDRRRTFADETTTGIRPEFRGPFKATIAARVDTEDYEWWLQFTRDFLPPGVEPKSSIVLPIIDHVPEARDRLLEGVSGTTIAIVDFGDYTRSLLEQLRLRFDRTGPSIDVATALREGRLPREFTERILRAAREDGVEISTVVRIEWLLRTAASGMGIISTEPTQIFDRNKLMEMHPEQLKELIARFSLALGDALHPDRQADIIERRLRDDRFITEGRVAYLALEETMAPDRVYDEGDARVFASLEDAHNRVDASLDRMRMFQLQQEVRAGRLEQDDSRRILGLQVADLAAAVARNVYEGTSGTTPQRSTKVRGIFRRVLLNDEWLA